MKDHDANIYGKHCNTITFAYLTIAVISASNEMVLQLMNYFKRFSHSKIKQNRIIVPFLPKMTQRCKKEKIAQLLINDE